MVAHTIIEDAGHFGEAACFGDKRYASNNSELFWSNECDIVAIFVD